MIGAIVGDIVGSHFEHFPTKQTDFEFLPERSSYTDDTVLTIAVADWLCRGGNLAHIFHNYVFRYPNAGYGPSFRNWALCGEMTPYQSWGNGAAMRVSPVAYARNNLAEVLQLASETSCVTHDHNEGIRGAKATAGAVFIARTGGTKQDIREFVRDEIGYDLSQSIDSIRPDYKFDVSCQGSVPQAILAFLEAETFEQSIRLAVSLGGDSDTMACIAGSIAEPYFGGVPNDLWAPCSALLDDFLRNRISTFRNRYSLPQYNG